MLVDKLPKKKTLNDKAAVLSSFFTLSIFLLNLIEALCFIATSPALRLRDTSRVPTLVRGPTSEIVTFYTYFLRMLCP